MIAILLAGLALPALHLPSIFPAAQVERHRYELKGWLIDTRQDLFTRKMTCKVVHRSMVAREGHLEFQFGHNTDTSQAYYRLGDGAAIALRGEVDTSRALASNLDRAPLANPSYGEVILPLARIGDAQTVAIRLNSRNPPTTFMLTGLSGALRSARALGCPDL